MIMTMHKEMKDSPVNQDAMKCGTPIIAIIPRDLGL